MYTIFNLSKGINFELSGDPDRDPPRGEAVEPMKGRRFYFLTQRGRLFPFVEERLGVSIPVPILQSNRESLGGPILVSQSPARGDGDGMMAARVARELPNQAWNLRVRDAKQQFALPLAVVPT